MKTPLIILFSVFLLINTSLFSQKYIGALSQTEFNLSADKMNFFANMFETKKQFYEFMDIKKGDVIAEIGAAEGLNLGVLSVLYDSITFYAQDIDAKALSQKKLNKTINYYSKKRSSVQTNTFKRVIGTMTSTNLPNNTFDQILIISSFHDFDKKDEMLDDISEKLKPNGKLIILDGYSFVGDTQRCPDNGGHILTTLDIEIKRFEKHGFYLTKMRSPNCNAAHYGNGLVFEKNKAKSEEFYKHKNLIDPLVSHSFRFKQKSVSSDSLIVKQITDSLITRIDEITKVYPEFEVWMKDIALRHLRKLNYQAAINILEANKKLFPNSIHAYYWLSLAYKENKQTEISKKYLSDYEKLRTGNANFQQPISPN